MPHTSWVPVSIVALLALTTFWLGKVASTQPLQGSGGFTHDPDYVVENFAALTFDAQGRPDSRLSAKKMVHYMDDDSTELEAPRFERQDGKSAPISVHSGRGLITAEHEDVYFLGDVRVTRAATQGQAAIELTTEYIRLVPDHEILRTEKPVIMRQGKSVVEASGLFIDGEKRVFELAGRVKAIYEKRQ
jgi:lipopolysaccharide export system protein LptC